MGSELNRKILLLVSLFVVLPSLLSSNIMGITSFQTSLITTTELASNMPVIYLDPPRITKVAPGENFTVSVKAYNLTASIWQTN